MENLLMVVSIIVAIGAVAGTVMGIIKYVKGCAYYCYNPLKAAGCSLAFASWVLPCLGIALATAFMQQNLVIMGAIIMCSSLASGVGLIYYSIKRVYKVSGSKGFAVATYFVEILISWLICLTMGLFMLGAYYVVKKSKTRGIWVSFK